MCWSEKQFGVCCSNTNTGPIPTYAAIETVKAQSYFFRVETSHLTLMFEENHSVLQHRSEMGCFHASDHGPSASSDLRQKMPALSLKNERDTLFTHVSINSEVPLFICFCYLLIGVSFVVSFVDFRGCV